MKDIVYLQAFTAINCITLSYEHFDLSCDKQHTAVIPPLQRYGAFHNAARQQLYKNRSYISTL